MSNIIPAQPNSVRQPISGTSPSRFPRVLLLASLTAATLLAEAQTPRPTSSTIHKTPVASQKPVGRRKPTSAAKAPASVVPAAAEAVAPPAPRPPNWPVNDHPSEATVVWNSQGLRIQASNSSLSQIIRDVTASTGIRIQGLGADERIFGNYGPGTARDVLAQLLDGTGYNVLMIGDQGEGTPREILLSAQSRGGAQPVVNSQSDSSDSSDDNSDAEDQPEPQPEPPPNIRNGFTPGAPPRTPQQIMQEMQQRQMQQIQRQNNPQ